MDPYLASVYNTNDTIEKIANDILLQKAAEEYGVQSDISQLSPEQLEEIANEQLAIANGEYAGQNQESSQNIVKEAEANLELADYMGRVMAHAFHQERGMIEKMAGYEGFMGVPTAVGKAVQHGRAAAGAIGGAARSAGGAVAGAAKRVGGAVSGAAKSVGSGAMGAGKRYGELLAGGAKGEVGEMAGRRAGNSVTGFKQMRGEALKSTGARAATGAAAIGAGVGAHHMATKEASAFETLARQQAIALLQQNGLDTQPLLQHFEQQDQEAAMAEQEQMQQPQMGFQPQQGQGLNPRLRQGQQGQGQFQQPQMQQPQQQQDQQMNQQDQAVKMANDMVMNQFNQMLEQNAMQLLAEAGYDVGGDEQGQQQQQMPQQQMQ